MSHDPPPPQGQSPAASISFNPQNPRRPRGPAGPLAEVDLLSDCTAPRDGSGPLERDQGSARRTRVTGQIRAPQDGSGPRKTDQGPQDKSGPRGMNRGPRNTSGPAGEPKPRNTNQGSAVSQNYNFAWVSKWKIRAPKDSESGKNGAK